MKLTMNYNDHDNDCDDDDDNDDEKCVNQQRGGVVSQVAGSGCILPIGRNLGIALHFATLHWIPVHFVLCSSTLHWIVVYLSNLHFTKLHWIFFIKLDCVIFCNVQCLPAIERCLGIATH